MSKKGDSFYFNGFIACMDYACQAARILEGTLENFNPSTLEIKMEEIHLVEHDGDEKKHELMTELLQAFITPIEREDIISLSQNIDEVIDSIEDVLLRVYINNIQEIRPEAIQFVKVIIQCCDATKALMLEFANFKKSKTLHKLIVEINALEEEGDRLFITSMRTLHTTSKSPIEIIAWREVYQYLEKCADVCEHVADVVESVVMKNT